MKLKYVYYIQICSPFQSFNLVFPQHHYYAINVHLLPLGALQMINLQFL